MYLFVVNEVVNLVSNTTQFLCYKNYSKKSKKLKNKVYKKETIFTILVVYVISVGTCVPLPFFLF
jgi:hypothetical protein